MAQAFPLPFLCGVAVFTDPKPVRRSPNTTNTDLSALGHKTHTHASFLTEKLNAIQHDEICQRDIEALIDDPLKSLI